MSKRKGTKHLFTGRSGKVMVVERNISKEMIAVSSSTTIWSSVTGCEAGVLLGGSASAAFLLFSLAAAGYLRWFPAYEGTNRFGSWLSCR